MTEHARQQLLGFLIDVYENLALKGIISDVDRVRYRNGIFTSDIDGMGAELFHGAISLSIADVMRVLGSHFFEEEQITGSLTGSLTANLTWFAKLFRIAGGTIPLPELRWVHQSKRVEARSGFDFGILVRSPTNNPGKEYRLIVFQAKLESDKHGIDIDHVTYREEDYFVPIWTRDSFDLLVAAAELGKSALTRQAALVEKAKRISMTNFKPKERRLQLQTLLRTDVRGYALTHSDRPWCFYASWSGERFARVTNIRSIARQILQDKSFNDFSPFGVKSTDPSFADILGKVCSDGACQYGLELSDGRVGSVVQNLFEIAPNLTILLVNPDPRFVNSLGRKSDRMVSGPLVDERLTPKRLPKVKPKQRQSTSKDDMLPSNDTNSSPPFGRF